MSEPHSCESELCAAIERNENDFYLFGGRHGEKEIGSDGSIDWVIARPYWPNYLIFPRYSGDIAQKLAKLGQRIEHKQLPPLFKVGPLAIPDDLLHYLANAGFTHFDYKPGMALPLKDLRRSPKTALEISEVTGDVELRAFVGKFDQFELSMLRSMSSEPHFHLFLGYHEGQPVATSMVFLSAGVAGIYYVGVDKSRRRQGFGAEITQAAVLKAAELGYSTAVLSATEIGKPVYERLGFRTHFSYEYFWWPETTYEDYNKAVTAS